MGARAAGGIFFGVKSLDKKLDFLKNLNLCDKIFWENPGGVKVLHNQGKELDLITAIIYNQIKDFFINVDTYVVFNVKIVKI